MSSIISDFLPAVRKIIFNSRITKHRKTLQTNRHNFAKNIFKVTMLSFVYKAVYVYIPLELRNFVYTVKTLFGGFGWP